MPIKCYMKYFSFINSLFGLSLILNYIFTNVVIRNVFHFVIIYLGARTFLYYLTIINYNTVVID